MLPGEASQEWLGLSNSPVLSKIQTVFFSPSSVLFSDGLAN